jgi:DNA-binding transcriptional ArsR family regulator
MLRHFKADLFKALSHPVRIRILDALRGGELSVGDLQAQLEVEQSTISQHLAALRVKDLVRAQRRGTTMLYEVTDASIWQMLDIARDIYERQLASNRAMFEAMK